MNRAIQTDRSGALAQLVERLHGMQEVSGSTPLSSTTEGLAEPPRGLRPFRLLFPDIQAGMARSSTAR